MLIGSSGGVGCCVILERAVLSRVLKADVSDMSVCVEMEGLGWGGQGEWHVWVIFECVVGLSRSM